MRDYQENVLNSYLKAINFGSKEENSEGSALIELWTGAGKTVLALKIIECNKKTIIFVHKTFLKNQWIENKGIFTRCKNRNNTRSNNRYRR